MSWWRREGSLILAGLSLAFGLASLVLAATPRDSDFMKGMHAGMNRMMNEMDHAGMTGDPDHDFLAMMIPHHAGAVEMARLELVYGRDPLVRSLAEDILANQQSEIAAMQARLKIMKNRKEGASEYPSTSGLRGESETR